jgi:hypothetical protein
MGYIYFNLRYHMASGPGHPRPSAACSTKPPRAEAYSLFPRIRAANISVVACHGPDLKIFSHSIPTVQIQTSMTTIVRNPTS